MNERIWDLFKQSGIDIGEDQESNIEKFAELLVKECLSVQKKCPHHIAPAKFVREHFGVK